MADSRDRTFRKLNDLIELDFDAIEAYDAAIGRLENGTFRMRLEEFREDHYRHTRNLAEQVLRLGGEPATGPNLMRHLTKGKVVLADLVGSDVAILLAMRANEEMTNQRYEAALEHDEHLDARARAVVASNFADERRHLEWIQMQLKLEEPGKVKGAEESPA